jgi:Ulp1 family protease
MSGLLGSMIAGAAGKAADGRVKQIEAQEKFSMEQALLDARIEKDLQLKKMGFEMEDARDQKERDRISSIANSVEDPMAGKGGYESEEDAAKRNRGLLQQKANKLAEAGELEAAKTYYARADQYDKTELSKAQLEAREKQIENTFTNAQEKLRLQGEANTAKAEAAAAKASAGNKPERRTMEEQEYDSYVAEIKGKGLKPMSLYQFNNWKAKQRKGADQFDTVSESTSTFDPDSGAEKKTTRTTKVPQEKPKPKPAGVLQKDKNGNYVFTR